MLSTTRVALSTDATVRFIVVKAHDPRVKVTATLIRHFPDIKKLIYFGISRANFEERLVLEMEYSPEELAEEDWEDLTLLQFQARLVASRLKLQFTGNPLLNAFLQIQSIKGDLLQDTLFLRVNDVDTEEGTSDLLRELLETAVRDMVLDVLDKYQSHEEIRRVVVETDSGQRILAFDLDQTGKETKENVKASRS